MASHATIKIDRIEPFIDQREIISKRATSVRCIENITPHPRLFTRAMHHADGGGDDGERDAVAKVEEVFIVSRLSLNHCTYTVCLWEGPWILRDALCGHVSTEFRFPELTHDAVTSRIEVNPWAKLTGGIFL